MAIVRTVFVRQTKPCHPVHLRPFQVQTTGDITSAITKEIEMKGEFSGGSLMTAASQFMQPAAIPQQQASIPNGWTEPRFRFFLEIEFENKLETKVELVTGYTDYPGATTTGAVDPNMTFYINSVIPLQKLSFRTPDGNKQSYNKAVNPSHVLFNNAPNASERYLTTPSVVLNSISAAEIEAVSNHVVLNGGKELGPIAQITNRANANPGRFAGKLIKDYKNSVQASVFNSGWDNRRSVLSNVRSMNYDSWYMEDLFITTLRQLTGDSGRSYFTYKELCQIDPNTDSLMQVHFDIQGESGISAELLSGSDYKTQQAFCAANIVPTIMMDFGLSELHITSTNRTLTGEIQTMITFTRSFCSAGVDLTVYFDAIIAKLNAELFQSMSGGNTIVYEITLGCDIIGTTEMYLILGDTIATPYIIPTFADSTFVPEISDQESSIDHLVDGFSKVFDIVDDTISRQTGQSFSNALTQDIPLLD